MGRPGYKPRFLDDEFHWLERALTPMPTPDHICGRCRTPWGRSQLPCPNDPSVQAHQQ